MSIIEEDLLAPRITKKNVIKVACVAGILFTLFTFSTLIYASILGTQRREPNERLEDAEREYPIKVLPELPFDLEDLLDDLDLDDLDLDDLEDLEDLGINITDIDIDDLDALADLIDNETLAEFLENMNDGDIDDYDLTMAGLAIAALVFSEVEVFRVFEYYYISDLSEREDILWKYECFDEFNGDGWQSTEPETGIEDEDLITLSDYWALYSYLEKVKLKLQLDPNLGTNSFVMGNLFPSGVIPLDFDPYIIEETISAFNLDPDPALSYLKKNEMGNVVADLTFTSSESSNLTYELFGSGMNLNTNDQINNSAVLASSTPASIQNQYLQLPPDISTYRTNNPSFNSHWTVLDTIISSADNAFMVANKIRNYLQANFELSFNELVDDPPEEGEDVVEWFCEKGEGMYSEFASAFCAFTRSFGVASRFVNGYNSRLIEEDYDPEEPGSSPNFYPIKYKNIYNWAEIYVPYDNTGIIGPTHGEWVQMDILWDSFGAGGSPIIIENYNLTVTSNASLPSLTYNRGDTANITAVLDSTGNPIDGRTITFTDETTGVTLGSETTNNDGIASLVVDVGTNHIVGPNIIRAEDQTGTNNITFYTIEDDIEVVITGMSRQEVNISQPDPTTRITGYLWDPSSSRNVADAELNLMLLYKGTNIPLPLNPFNIDTIYTDSNGEFDEVLTVQSYVPYGEYDFRIDFNGTWDLFGFLPFVYPSINDSSDIWDFNVTKEITFDILFSINGRPTEYGYEPLNPATLISVDRTQQLNLSVQVLDSIDKTVVPDINVDFYDYTNGPILIDSGVTDSNGNASILYILGTSQKAGPNLLYARVGGSQNFSYYILDEPFGIILTSGPSPLKINITGGVSDPFNVVGDVEDDQGNSVGFTEITLRIFDKIGNPYPGNLWPISPDSNPFTTLNDGHFDLDFRIDPTTPVGNYSLRMDFNGTIDFFSDSSNPYPYIFDLNFFSNSSLFQNDLEVYDPENVEIYFYVEDIPVNPPFGVSNPPQSYNRGENAYFNVTVIQSGGNPIGTIRLLDVYDITNPILGSHTFTGSTQDFQFIIPTNNFNFAGIHKIQAQFESSPPNTTYIVINESFEVYANPLITTPRIDNLVQRDLESFTVTGFIWENGTGLKGLRVRLKLFNETGDDFSSYLVGDPFALTNSNGNFTININSIDINCPQGLYYIRVDFNGSINILDESPVINLIPDYMVHRSSISPVYLNITAGTIITLTNYYTTADFLPDDWIRNSILYISGNLALDNTNPFVGMYINVSIQWNNGTIIASNNTEITDPSGDFTVSFLINEDWPDLRSESKIVLYFDPQYNSILNIEPANFTHLFT